MGLPVHGYLTGSRPIFATYHTPTEPARDVAYVICPPLGWESIQCYHSMRLLGEALAASGIGALRLAYDGTGESPGSGDDPARVSAWIDSINVAIDSLRRARGVRTVGLIGIRMGATLAACASAEREVDRLVLWEPCLSGAHYTREMEILASAAPRPVGEAGGGHGEEADGAPRIEAGGYVLTTETMADLAAVDLLRTHPLGAPEVLLLARDDRPPPTRLAEHLATAGCATVVERMGGFKEMMVYPDRSVPPQEGLERIKTWAAAAAGVIVGPTARAPWLPDEVTHEGTRRKAFRFGPGRRLFGVVSEPEGGSEPRAPAVVLLTGGVVPRTAVNRMYVDLADRLVRRGHRVLRFDVSGIGESYPEAGHQGRDPYPPGLLDDVRAALHEATGHHEARGLWLIGLCSGAYAAFRTALEDERVLGVVLLNPLVYELQTGESSRSMGAQQYVAAGYYRKAFFRLASWKHVFSGQGDLRYPIRLLARRARTWITTRRARLSGLLGASATGASGAFLQLLRRGTGVHIIFSAGDAGVAALSAQVGGSPRALQRAGLDLEIVQDADHTFNALRVRHRVLDRIVSVVSAAPTPVTTPPSARGASRVTAV